MKFGRWAIFLLGIWGCPSPQRGYTCLVNATDPCPDGLQCTTCPDGFQCMSGYCQKSADLGVPAAGDMSSVLDMSLPPDVGSQGDLASVQDLTPPADLACLPKNADCVFDSDCCSNKCNTSSFLCQ
jgi:hypothetical protein